MKNNPYDRLVAFIYSNKITPKEEVRLIEIIKEIYNHENEKKKIVNDIKCNCEELTKNKEMCPVHDKEAIDNFQNILSKAMDEFRSELES